MLLWLQDLTLMELDLDTSDVYLDARFALAKLSDTGSTFISHLESDGPVDSEYREYLMQMLGDLVRQSEDDVLLERQSDDTSFDDHHHPRCRIFSSDESEDDLIMERRSGHTGSDDDDDDDPQYSIFLSHAKQRGKSYALQVRGENGLPKFIEYEVHSEHDDLPIIKSKMKNGTEGDGEHPRSVQNEYTTGTSSVQESERKRLQVDRNNKISFSRCASLGKNDFLSQNLHCDPKCDLGKVPKTKSRRICSDLAKGEKISDASDEEYQYFLDNSETETGFTILRLPDGDVIKYEKTYGSEAAHSKMEEEEEEEEEDGCLCLGSPSEEKSSRFRQNVMSILRKPYDHEECKKLWHDINIRKKTTRNRVLRYGREKPYSANKVGKSYLDYHKDLCEKIEAVEDDQCKKLNILRGFFFWLQVKLVHSALSTIVARSK